ncbi:hypothetical protein FNV43_RR00943 [Rhamnella rubrinervis]|uniref:Bet v I/Major latex protein domain-containing protein n=1 Tax=Rhamnella rubrinervis TaxID=2594499 RepID=A0A8K0MSH3_9ROSA|nr:hypothetical protein FNV43_RR00943 [Rhamnella rubrinervis]
MGVSTFETEVTSVVAPARLFKALILDADNLIPKVVPQAFKSAEIISGNGGPGTIKKIHFAEGSPYKYVVHKIDTVDTENHTFSHTVIEGDLLGDKLEKIAHETKIVAGSDGGSILKNTSKYFTKGDHGVDEQFVNEGKEKGIALLKAIEAYLVANPDAYN